MEKNRLTRSLLLLLLVSGLSLQGQNLVPDSSFEDITTPYCGITSSPAQFNGAFNQWNCPTSAEPDQYSLLVPTTCFNHATNGSPSGPIPPKGSQTPRTGDVHVGLYLYTISGLEQREYIQIRLSQPMSQGQQYLLRYHVSLADQIEWATSSIGAYFSDTQVSGGSGPLPYSPQAQNTAMLPDTSLWMEVRDTVTASGSWEYLVIGNFANDANTNLAANPGSGLGPGQYGAYYFIDDVSVTPLEPMLSVENPWLTGNATVPSWFKVGHSPAVGPRYDEGGSTLEFKVFDMSGRVVHVQEGEGQGWEGRNAATGMYIWNLKWMDRGGYERNDMGKIMLTR